MSLATALLTFGAGPVFGQTLVAPVGSSLPGSTRALGLGNAYPLASAESDAIFYNPALLTNARGVSGSVSRYGPSSLQFAVSGAMAWWDGGVGFGASSLGYSASSLADGAFARGEAGLGDSGTIHGSEQIISVAYARTVFGFRVGIAGKLIDYRAGGGRDATAAADIGIARNVGPVTLGLTGRDLGRDPAMETFDAELPTGVTLAAGSGSRRVGPLDLMAAASTSWRRETWAADGGIEVSYYPVQGRTFRGRAGFRWIEDSDLSPLTLGAGFSGDVISIDWAFEDVKDGEAVHRITVRLR